MCAFVNYGSRNIRESEGRPSLPRVMMFQSGCWVRKDSVLPASKQSVNTPGRTWWKYGKSVSPSLTNMNTKKEKTLVMVIVDLTLSGGRSSRRKGAPSSPETRSEHDICVALSNSHQKSVRSYFTRDQAAEDVPTASGVVGLDAGWRCNRRLAWTWRPPAAPLTPALWDGGGLLAEDTNTC